MPNHPYRVSFFEKMKHWEYWPLPLASAPVVLIWLWFALRARRLFFFSIVNPVIQNGGVMGESKIDILRRLPAQYVPETLFVAAGTPLGQIRREMVSAQLTYPLIAKPDIGERGFRVAKLRSEEDLTAYLDTRPPDFLLQEYVDLPIELAVMHHRMPDTGEGRVTSICYKETMKVVGDGHSSIRQLMAADLRSRLQLPRFEKEYPVLLDTVLPAGERIEVEPIGNHCRGTCFLNYNHRIDEDIHGVFNGAASKMEGIHYGRFDLRTASWDDLRQGRFLVLEYNGLGAEPAHIYDPAMPVWEKYRSYYRHWKIIYRIYLQQKALGHRPMGLAEAWQQLRAYRRYYANYRM